MPKHQLIAQHIALFEENCSHHDWCRSFVKDFDSEKCDCGHKKQKDFIATALSQAYDAGGMDRLKEMMREATKRSKEWEESEDYDYTRNDGLYSFGQYLSTLLEQAIDKETKI